MTTTTTTTTTRSLWTISDTLDYHHSLWAGVYTSLEAAQKACQDAYDEVFEEDSHTLVWKEGDAGENELGRWWKAPTLDSDDCYEIVEHKNAI